MLEITGNIFARDSWSHKPITPEIALCVTTNGVVKASGQAVMGAGLAKDLYAYLSTTAYDSWSEIGLLWQPNPLSFD